MSHKLVLALLISFYFLPLSLQAKVVRDYYDSGALQSETPYQDGKHNGVEKLYSQDGRFMIRINYVDGKEVGRWER